MCLQGDISNSLAGFLRRVLGSCKTWLALRNKEGKAEKQLKMRKARCHGRWESGVILWCGDTQLRAGPGWPGMPVEDDFVAFGVILLIVCFSCGFAK